MEVQENLTQSQAVNVLIQAARIAQGKGAFTLEDAELVARAIRVFVPEGEAQNEGNDPVVNQEEVSSTETTT
jgi:phosphoribosylamine-glycine ligase